MTDFAIDPATGDLALDSSGSPYLVEGAEAIAQNLRVRFRFWLGDWFLDQRKGIPYRDQILVKNPSYVVIRSVFTQVILGTPGVDSLRSLVFSIDAKERAMDLSFVAVLTTGEILEFEDAFEVQL